MILRELFYFDELTAEPVTDDTYEPEHDTSPIDYDDTRKTRLSLRQINRIRKSSELHTTEQQNELEFVRQMYGITAVMNAGGGV